MTPEPAGSKEGQVERGEYLGQIVREEWIRWAQEQPNPKASWLQAWQELTEPEREVDRRIGLRIYHHALEALYEPLVPATALSARDAQIRELKAALKKIETEWYDLDRLALLDITVPLLFSPSTGEKTTEGCPGWSHCNKGACQVSGECKFREQSASTEGEA